MKINRFDEAHTAWLENHLSRRTGERKGRLERGHHHGEKLVKKVWWPMIGNLEHLHPEYEVKDWRGRPNFIDFAWLPGHAKIALEVKGFGPHVQDMNRQRYCYELNRETFLKGLGFRVVSIPYDDVVEQPQLIITLLRGVLGQFIDLEQSERSPYAEVEVHKLAHSMNKPIRPIDVEITLCINHRTAVKLLQSLCNRGKMRPILNGNSGKVCYYELVHRNDDHFEW